MLTIMIEVMRENLGLPFNSKKYSAQRHSRFNQWQAEVRSFDSFKYKLALIAPNDRLVLILGREL